VPLTVTANRADLLLHATVTNPDGGKPIMDKPIHAIGQGDYAASLAIPPDIWRVEVATAAEVVPVATSDIVWVVDA